MGLERINLRVKQERINSLGKKDGHRTVDELTEWLKLFDKNSIVWTYESVLVCGEDGGYVFWTEE